jgi:hypothetical protein
MELEFELDHQAEELIKQNTLSHQNLCPKCNQPVSGMVCKSCGAKIASSRDTYSDPDYEEYAEKVEKENEEFFNKIKWEDIPDKELDKLEEELLKS